MDPIKDLELCHGDLTIEGGIDKDGEVEVMVNGTRNESRVWIDADQAQAIVNHLTKVFSL